MAYRSRSARMSGDAPLVSVVIPTYNRSGTIVSAVKSVLEQDYQPIEIIIVDDASTDDTVERLSGCGTAVRVIRQPNNKGPAAARNAGISSAVGDYVAFLDSDDLWAPDKTSRQLEFMRRHGFVMSCTGFSSIYQIGGQAIRKRRPYGMFITLDDIVWGVYVAPGTTLVADRRLLTAIGGYDTSLRRLEDWELLLKALVQSGRLGFLDVDLAVLRPSSGCSIEILETSADQLLARAASILSERSPRLLRTLRAGVAFELAASHWRRGSRGKSLRWLWETFRLVPFRNQCLRIILVQWLRDRMVGAR